MEHLQELRQRILKSIAAVLVFTVISFFYAKYIFEILKYPIDVYYPGMKLVTLSPTEPLFIMMEISVIVGIILAIPIILYQIWKFVEPALYPEEKKLVFPLVFFSLLLFVMGATFAYFAVLPMALKFLIGVGFSQLRANPMLSAELYINFLLKMLLGFGIAFEMPIFLFMLQRAGIVSTKQLKSFRKYFIVVAFFIGALIAPDVSTQILMALPLIVLYEISIFVGRFAVKKPNTTSKDIQKA